MAKADYAQRQRDKAYGLGEMKKTSKRTYPSKVIGKSVPDESDDKLAEELSASALEILMREDINPQIVRLEKARLEKVSSAASINERLDISMARFMKEMHYITVEKSENWASGMSTYRFINPATGDYYDVTHDDRLDDDYHSAESSRRAMMDEAVGHFTHQKEKSRLAVASINGRYTDAEGRTFQTKVPEEKPKHREGHFPTHWVEEAMDRAEASDMCITITMERKGVMVVATEGEDKYSSHVITWEMMEKSKVNPLPLAIEDCEKKLVLLGKIKAKVRK